MQNVLWEWRYAIIGIILVLLYSAFEWNNVKSLAYKTMLQAKDLAKDKILNCGQAQEDWVVDKLVDILPARVRIFLGQDAIRSIVRFLYRKGMDYLDDGKLNDSFKPREEQPKIEE